VINNKEDYIEYLKADKEANHIGNTFSRKILVTWKYLKCMRKLEYVINCKTGIWARIQMFVLKYRFYRISVKSGLTIPANTFGKGLYIAHHGSVVVNPSARFGDNCVVQNGVNISNDVVGGNHIYLGAGAKIMIGVHIADDVIVGANAVVTKDITEPNIVVAGLPARKISCNGFHDRKKV
jgi:serine O-acetyltransferase